MSVEPGRSRQPGHDRWRSWPVTLAVLLAPIPAVVLLAVG